MVRSLRWTVAVLAFLALSLSALLTIPSGALGRAHADTTPPWEPDPTSVGSLTFYDASGTVVTTGSINDAPFAAYAASSATVRTGDVKATLFGYLPKNGVDPSGWTGEQLSASTTYPNISAPAPLNSSTFPVVTQAAGDVTLADLVLDLPNTATDAYQGLYQLRLKTSGGSGNPGLSPSYASADIQITGSTWTQVYPAPGSGPVTTGTTLAISPTATTVNHGTKVTLNATVAPSDAVGSVKFFDGSKVLATKAVAAGKASFSTTTLSNAKHTLKATFVPTDATAFTGSTSATKTVTVVARATTTKLGVKPGLKVKKGTKLALTATVAPSSAGGKVTFWDGKKKLATVKVTKGVAKFSKVLAPGKHSLKATFAPTSTAAYKGSTSKVVTVTVKK